MTILYSGASLVTQKYEFDIRHKRVLFITLIANYVRIKGEKYKQRVKFDKKKRIKIFHLIEQIDIKNLNLKDICINNQNHYAVSVSFTDKTIKNHTFIEENLPFEFIKLYNSVIDKKHFDKTEY